MDKGSVSPRGEPATDGGSAAALPVSGGGGCLWGGRGHDDEVMGGSKSGADSSMQARAIPFALPTVKRLT